MSLLSESCAEAARIISDSQDSDLPLPARVGLRLHLAICRHCRQYQRQVRILRSVFSAYPNQFPPLRLPEDFRQHLVRKLKETS
jgi:hypothetical protein